MKRILITSFMIFSFVTIGLSVTAVAERDHTIGEVLERIEKHEKNGDRQDLIDLLRCLWVPAVEYVNDYDKFIAEGVFDDIEEATYGDRLDVIRVLDPMIDSKDSILRGEVAAALAYYGYPPAKQWLRDFPDGPQKAIFFAILDHKRAYRWAIDQLKIADIKERSGENDLLVERMAYLNLIFYLAEPASLPFLDGLLVSAADEKIKDRAKMAKDRILELHPEIK